MAKCSIYNSFGEFAKLNGPSLKVLKTETSKNSMMFLDKQDSDSWRSYWKIICDNDDEEGAFHARLNSVNSISIGHLRTLSLVSSTNYLLKVT